MADLPEEVWAVRCADGSVMLRVTQFPAGPRPPQHRYVPASTLDDAHADVAAYRTAIRAALDVMSDLTDMQLGPGGGARRAYAALQHAYYAIPAGIPTPPVDPATPDTQDDHGR